MQIHVRVQLLSLLALSSIAWVGCGDSPTRPEKSDDKDATAPGAEDAGSDAATGMGDASMPHEAAQCEPNEARCHGFCFDRAGQKAAGCELLLALSSPYESIAYAVFDEHTAYVSTHNIDDRTTFDIHRLNLDDGTATTVARKIFYDLEGARVYEGGLYFYGDAGDTSLGNHVGSTILKLEAGAFTPATGAVSRYNLQPWLVADGSAYFVEQHEGSVQSDIFRVPLGDRLDDRFVLAIEDGGEVVVRDAYVDGLVSDGEYLYYTSSTAEGGLSRVKLGDPTAIMLLDDTLNYFAIDDLRLPATDAQNVYFSIGGLWRVSRTGSPAAQVLTEATTHQWLGSEELLAYGDGLDGHTFRAYPYASLEEHVVDTDGNELLAAWATQDAYYATSAQGLMRISR